MTKADNTTREGTVRNGGMIAAVAAVAVLGGVLAWRSLPQDTPEPAAPAGDASAPVATGPSIEQLQAEAGQSPDDARGWQRLGLALFQSGRFAEAITAYERATGVDGESAVLWSSLGEARVMASGDDPLPPEATTAFERALELDPADPRARYFLAVGRDLAGDHEGAIADWLALLADTPPGAPWENDLVRTIQQVGRINEIPVTGRITAAAGTRNILPAGSAGPGASGPGAPGPSAEQVAAAAALPASQQQAMAEGMVARLATRLESEPEDVDGWIMLMRSYTQLGRTGDARQARDAAIAANPQASDRIGEAASTFGID